MFPPKLLAAAAELITHYRARSLRLASAESCTGGMIAALLTEIPGSSDVFERGYVTYSNEAKMELLGVDPPLLAAHGAVSAQVAKAMAEGALTRSHAQVSIAVTGIAGPGGGSAEKPVGLVYLALADAAGAGVTECRFSGERTAIRLAAVNKVLELLKEKV